MWKVGRGGGPKKKCVAMPPFDDKPDEAAGPDEPGAPNNALQRPFEVAPRGEFRRETLAFCESPSDLPIGLTARETRLIDQLRQVKPDSHHEAALLKAIEMWAGGGGGFAELSIYDEPAPPPNSMTLKEQYLRCWLLYYARSLRRRRNKEGVLEADVAAGALRGERVRAARLEEALESERQRALHAEQTLAGELEREEKTRRREAELAAQLEQQAQ